MRQKTSRGLIPSILKQLKRLAFTLTEKPSTSVEEYTLEHFLLYHGLVGTTPENQPEFRHVRADLMEALEQKSSANLAIALKLPPLWWQEKLQSIFAELEASDRTSTVNLLLPAPEGSGEIPESEDPLRNPDWRVRANAASMLAFLGVKQAVPCLISSLAESASGLLKAAFCHLAFALEHLRTVEARRALAGYLADDEPWFRVDAARALAGWPFEEVAPDLAGALLAHHSLSDYVAVNVGRRQPALKFLRHADPLVREAGLEMVIEILHGSSQTHPPETATDCGVHKCWPAVLEGMQGSPGPRRIRCAIALADWLQEQLPAGGDLILAEIQDESPALTAADLSAQLKGLAGKLAEPHLRSSLVERIERLDRGQTDPAYLGETRHAVWLLGHLGIREGVPALVNLLKEHPDCLDQVIEALGGLGDPQVAASLVELARSTIDMDSRQSHPLSELPVEEPDPQAARTYWAVLRALGKLSHPQGLELLLEATEDYAPDKRRQAFESLIAASPADVPADPRLARAIEHGLQDPSPQVKLAALDGVSRFRLSALLPRVLRLFDSKEVSISRKSLTILSELACHGHTAEVVSAVEAKIHGEFDRYKKERLARFLDGIS